MKFTRRGFTLIELIVVATIIALLAGAGAVSYARFNRQARDAKRKADMEQLRGALEIYRSDNGQYPPTAAGGFYSSEPSDLVSNNGGDYIPGLAPQYIPTLPRDPKGDASTICAGWKKAYLYISDPTGTNFKVISHCAPESVDLSDIANRKLTDPYYDPTRPGWAWQVSSSVTSRGDADGSGY